MQLVVAYEEAEVPHRLLHLEVLGEQVGGLLLDVLLLCSHEAVERHALVLRQVDQPQLLDGGEVALDAVRHDVADLTHQATEAQQLGMEAVEERIDVHARPREGHHRGLYDAEEFVEVRLQ